MCIKTVYWFPVMWKGIRTVLVALALLGGGVGPASAQSTEVTVEDFFEVQPSDRSSAFMAELFGPEAWNAATFSTSTRVDATDRGGDGGMLGLISSVLNLACMLLTVLIITWGGIALNLQGAMSGVEAGRRYSMLWMPLRSVFSFGMLLPVMAGYSLVQMVMMWSIHLSIGIANSGYNLVLDNFFSGKPSVPIYVNGAKKTASDVFMMEVCRLGLVDADGNSLIGRRAEQDESVDWSNAAQDIGHRFLPGIDRPLFDGGAMTMAASASYSGLPGSGLPEAVCGAELVKQTSNVGMFGDGRIHDAAGELFNARIAALDQLHTDMSQIASDLATMMSNHSTSLPSQHSGSTGNFAVDQAYGRFYQAYTKYRKAITDAASGAASVLVSENPDRYIDKLPESAVKDEIRGGGWIMTGALYWNMQALNRVINGVVNRSGDISTTAPDFDTIARMGVINPQFWSDMQGAAYRVAQLSMADLNARDNERALKTYVASYGTTGNATLSLNNVWDAVGDVFSFSMISDGVTRLILDDGDFLWGLMGMGEVAWNVGWGAMTVGLVGVGADQVAGAVTGGDGKDGPGKLSASKLAMGKVLTALAGSIGSFLVMVAVPLILIGFFLGFYLPAVPLLLWLINIVGWMMQSVKAVMAVPIWAAVHAIPEGEGIAGTHARRGYLLIVGTVLRPLLLIAGILIGAVMLQVVGWLCRFLLPMMFASLETTSPPAFMSFLATLLIVVGALVALTLKCFSLSHEIADELLEWGGGSAVSVGDEGSSNRTQQIIVAAGAGTGVQSLVSGARAGAESFHGAMAGMNQAGRGTGAAGPAGKASKDDRDGHLTR